MGAPRVTLPDRPTDTQLLRALSFGPFTFDTARRLLHRNGQELAVPPRVLGVLERLLLRAGEVLPRQELIDTVWKDAFVTDTSLAEAISALRQVLGDDPQNPTYIQTLHRRGYRFIAPITPALEATPSVPPAETSGGAGRVRVSPSIGMELVPWSVAVISLLIAAAAVWQYTRRAPAAEPPAARFAVTAAPGTWFDSTSPAVAVSPDARLIAWSGCDAYVCQLYTRPIDRVDAAPLPGTRGAHGPFFSPDGLSIAFFADGRLMKTSVAGGAPVAITDAPAPAGGAWTGSEIVFAGFPSGGLMRVPAEGGEPRALTMPNEAAGEVRHTFPSLVPGTQTIVFTIDTRPSGDVRGTSGLLAVVSLEGTRGWRTLLSGIALARAAAPDLLVFGRHAELHAVAFDPTRLETFGVPMQVATELASAAGRTQFAVAPSGALLHIPLAAKAGVGGGTTAAESGPLHDSLQDVATSADGARAAGVKLEAGRAEIWISDVRRGTSTRLMHTGVSAAPVWSADGRTVYFANRTQGAFEIWARDADGSTSSGRLFAAEGRHALPLAASPDGRLLAFLLTADATRADIWVLPVDGGSAKRMVQTVFDEGAATFSPDSSMLAFQSAESGRWEIYVQRIVDGGRIVVSTGGGERPVWTRDGLFYQSAGSIRRATVRIAPDGLVVDDHIDVPLTDAGRRGLQSGATLQRIGPDGGVVLSPSEQAHQTSAVVSLEWIREARRALGPPEARLPR